MPISTQGGSFQQAQPKPKVLVAAEMATSAATLYTVPKGCSGTEITFISAFNTNGSATTFGLQIESVAGTAFYIYYNPSLATVTADWPLENNRSIFLQQGWSIKGLASQGGDVEFVASGIEYFLPQGGASA